MEYRGVSAGQGGPGSQSRLLNLPSELLLRVLRQAEDGYLERGQSSAEFLQLRAVCKKLQQSVDVGITNLSRGIAHRFCDDGRVLQVSGELQRQLARWGSLRRVELHLRGSHSALAHLIPALGQGCPGLTALHILLIWGPFEYLAHGRTCEEISLLTSLASLECLSLRGFNYLGATLPSLPTLRTLHADFNELACPSPLPSLEELVLGSEPGSRRISRVDMPHLHASSHLRRLSLKMLFMDRLRLPERLQVLDLDGVKVRNPLDLSTELPELAEVLFAYSSVSWPGSEFGQGLATLLSRGHLRRLKLQYMPGLTALDMLSSHTGLTSLSLHSLEVEEAPHMLQAVAVLTSLTELQLVNLPLCGVLDISHLKLHRLELQRLPSLSLIGLDMQTQLTSLTLAKLPLITHLPDLGNFKGLTELKLRSLQLEKWSPRCCSFCPKLKVLHVLEVEGRPSDAILDTPSLNPRLHVETATDSLDLESLTTLTDLSLRGFDGPVFNVASLPLLEKLCLENCQQLAHLVGIRSLPRLRSLELRGSNPLLETLTIASCPRLMTFLCEAEHLQSLNIEGLPLLPILQALPLSLRSLRVASCPAMQRLHIMALLALESLDLSEVGCMPSLSLETNAALKSIRLNNLTGLTDLGISNCPDLNSFEVSGSPLTSLSLANLPRLSGLDQLSTQTGLTSLRLQGLHLTRLPESLCSLMALSELELVSLEVDFWEPALADSSLPTPCQLATSSDSEGVHCVGSETVRMVFNVASLPLLEKLRLEHCQQLVHLVAFRSLPRLRSLEIRGSNPLLETLTIASCPRLTTLSCDASHLQSLDIEDLPLLNSLQDLPVSLRSLRVASCPAMQRLHIMGREALESLDLSDLGCMPSLSLESNAALKSIRLNNLTALTDLGISDCPHLDSVQVFGCPLTALRLAKLPAHFSSLDHLMCQTVLVTLRLQGLHLARLPESLCSLTALSALELVSLEVDCWEPALADSSLPTPCQLATSSDSEGVHCVGSETVRLTASPVGQWRPTFSSIKRLSLDGVKVGSLDVSQLARIQSLSIEDCVLLNCLAGIADLPDLKSVSVRNTPELQELAVLRCPRLATLACDLESLLHLHLEDLRSLNVDHFRFKEGQWKGSDGLRLSPAPTVPLKSLKLRSLPLLTTVDLDGLPALESLEVDGCSSLRWIHLSDFLHALTSLSLQQVNSRIFL